MTRLFLSLYAALVVAFLICVLGVPWLLNVSLKMPIARYGERLAAAPQYLFEQELRTIPQSQWPEHVRELQQYFGYELTLQKLGEVEADEQMLQLLRRGQAVSPSVDNNQLDTMLLPIRGSGYVVRTSFNESQVEQAQRSLGGIFHLLEKHLLAMTPAQRSAELQHFSAQYQIPVQLTTEAQTGLGPTQIRQLRLHQVVGINMNGVSDERYFKLLDNIGVVKIGPLPVPAAVRFSTLAAYGAFAAVLAMIAFLWIRPVWRDMRRLDQHVAEFGAGNLSSRVEVGSGSAIKALADAFNSMAQQIQSLVTTQREMSNAVSHELRTPLARLRFAVDMLSRTANVADQSRYIAGAHTDIRELEELIDESLGYARLTAPATMTLQMEPAVVVDWLQEILDAGKHVAGAIALSHQVNMAVASTSYDRRLLRRALQNLLNNALQHARSRVQVTATDRSGALELIVDDDGPGIPLDQLEVIFLPFHRVDSSRSRATGGYGLGLAIAKRICELHHADIFVEDSPLGGARFRIRFSVEVRS